MLLYSPVFSKLTMLLLCVLTATIVTTLAEPELTRAPDPTRCAHRKIHDTFNGHGFMFSWEEPKTVGLELSWPEAREFCRSRCMDLASLETHPENEFIKEHIARGNQRYVWTSGRKCNFKGCDRADLQPVNVYGWFWAGSLVRMPPTTNRLDSDWSETGGFGRPQPDNREHYQGGSEEECLAILNNVYDDGIHWHDVACRHRKPFVCEDSDDLLQILQRADDSSIDVLASEKLAVFDDRTQKLIPPFPDNTKEQSGLKSAQGSLVPAISSSVANAVGDEAAEHVNEDAVRLVSVPATRHTVMMVAERPAIPLEGQSSDISSDDKVVPVNSDKPA